MTPEEIRQPTMGKVFVALYKDSMTNITCKPADLLPGDRATGAGGLVKGDVVESVDAVRAGFVRLVVIDRKGARVYRMAHPAQDVTVARDA